MDHYYELSNNLLDYEEEDALKWRQPTQLVDEIEYDTNSPDDSWMVPVTEGGKIDVQLILGKRQQNLNHIEKITNTHMMYDERSYLIKMWGIREDLDDALRQFNKIANSVFAKTPSFKRSQHKEKNEQQPKPVEAPWAKPKRAPRNKREEEKLKRRETRRLEESVYKETPKSKDRFLFHGFFVFPNIDNNPTFNENDLDPLRVETKCHIWHDPDSTRLIKISGDSRESVNEAAARVQNLFIKTFHQSRITDKGEIIHMIEPPHEPYMVRIADPSSWIGLPYKFTVKLLEPVYEGRSIPVVGKEDSSKELNPTFNLNNFQKIRESNTKRLKDALLNAFTTIHLLDHEIKMRIRFGHVCLTRFPKNPLSSIEELDKRFQRGYRDISVFSTCIATEDQQFDCLSEHLSENKIICRPSREFKICVIRKMTMPSGEKQEIPCVFVVEKYIHDSKMKIGLWKITTNEKNILDIKMIHLENDYSWNLKIQTAQRLPKEDAQDIQKKFIDTLHICPKGRLVYSNTREIRVVSVCEKTRWKYLWGKDYTVEVTKYEFWDLSNNKYVSPVLELPLNKEDPPSVSYGVSLYYESLDKELILNHGLRVGEAPEWHPYDVIEKMMDEDRNFLNDIQDFLDILQKCILKNVESEI